MKIEIIDNCCFVSALSEPEKAYSIIKKYFDMYSGWEGYRVYDEMLLLDDGTIVITPTRTDTDCNFMQSWVEDALKRFSEDTPASKKASVSDKIDAAREFCKVVTALAKKMNLNAFVVTDGASAISNNGNECVRFHREKQIEWENENGYDPDEDWQNSKKYFSR